MEKGSLLIQGDSPVNVKILPCKIEYTGETTTEGYVPTEDTGSLYGRKLVGTTITLPNGFEGYVTTGKTDLITTSKFSSIKYWNWDIPPHSSDQLPSILTHLQLMQTLYNS